VLVWNRRLHYYLGLYLLVACWLFALTGVLLNHPTWEFARFWPQRTQMRVERPFTGSEGTTDLDRARDLMRQFELVGDVQWPTRQAAVAAPFSFQVVRPGHATDVQADMATGRAIVHRNTYNTWGVLHTLHTFSGVRSNDQRNVRDWPLTTVWVLSMDAVALGLILMVLSSYLMWFQLPSRRRWGVVALLLGVVSCGAFIVGVRWLT
jgi:hypothetical protein